MGGVGWDMAPDGVDVGCFDALIAKLSTTQCIDTTRVFAAGHSHGASFSNHLGCYRSDVVRAIAPVAPARYAAFLPRWQGVHARPTDRPRGLDALLDAIDQLEGVPLPD